MSSERREESRETYAGLEQLVGRIREVRAHERELKPFTPEWYEAYRLEAQLLGELKARFQVMDVAEVVEWVVGQK